MNPARTVETSATEFGLIVKVRYILATTESSQEFTELRPPARFISLSVRAGEVFANRDKALAWLETPNPSLQGRSPFEAATTEEGFQEADDILTRIEHGVLG